MPDPGRDGVRCGVADNGTDDAKRTVRVSRLLGAVDAPG